MKSRLSVLMPILLCALVTSLRAQNFGQIQGNVFDASTKSALAGANLTLVHTVIGTASDRDGGFLLPRIQPGVYELRASFIGYETQSIKIEVHAGETVRLALGLQPSAVQFDQIVVTATRQPEKLAEAVNSISVLGAAGIRDRNPMRIDEALQSVPGVSIVGDYINIRGGSGLNRLGGGRVLVLLDDVPILTSDLGAANWDILPVTEVSHIEVLKGAASSQYGAGALSGVINILTKPASNKSQFSVREMAGVYDAPSVPAWHWTDATRSYHRTDVGWSGAAGPIKLRLAMSRHQSTGDRRNGDFQRWYFTGKTVIEPRPDAKLTLFATYSRSKQGLFLQWLDQNNALDLAENDRSNRLDLDGIVAYATYEQLLSPRLSLRWRGSYNRQLVGIPFNIANDFTPALGLGSEAQIQFVPQKDHRVSFGMEYKQDDVESKYYGKQHGVALSPYLQEIWKISSIWQMNLGLRLDTYTLVGDSTEWQLSPKLGFSYQPWAGTIFHGSWGQGFRAATVLERFVNAAARDFRAIPNPMLQPERSTLLDLGIRQKFARIFSLEVTAFSSTYRNLIEPMLDPSLTVQFKNTANARIQGIESEIRSTFWRDHISLQLSGTWMDPQEIDSATPLPYRPRFLGFFGAQCHWRSWQLSGELRYVSRFQNVVLYPLDERVPEKIVNFHLSYDWHGLIVHAEVKNALNYNYTQVERVLGEIRNFALSFSWGI